MFILKKINKILYYFYFAAPAAEKGVGVPSGAYPSMRMFRASAALRERSEAKRPLVRIRSIVLLTRSDSHSRFKRPPD